MEQAQLRISLIGPTGSGKTTTAWLMQRIVPGAVVLSLAQPLRDIEEYIYRTLGHAPPSITGVQDGTLLQQIRSILFERDPEILASSFERAVKACSPSTLVINDDCRAGSKPYLDNLNFKYIWIEGAHSERRVDVTAAKHTASPHDAVLSISDCEFSLTNTGSLADLVQSVSSFVEMLDLRR